MDVKERRERVITELKTAREQAEHWQNRAIGLEAQLVLLNELSASGPMQTAGANGAPPDIQNFA